MSTTHKVKSAKAAVGFRVKSGWAVAVLLGGPKLSPHALDRRAIYLSDPSAPESKQPYHAKMGTLEENRSKLRRRTKIVQRVTEKSIADLLRSYRDLGYGIRAAGLVVGSLIDPAKISNPHIRAHALEGRLFRTVLEKALRSHRLPCLVVIERNAYSKATAALGRSENQLKRTVSGFGASLNGPWRVDEKVATLAAWMALK